MQNLIRITTGSEVVEGAEAKVSAFYSAFDGATYGEPLFKSPYNQAQIANQKEDSVRGGRHDVFGSWSTRVFDAGAPSVANARHGIIKVYASRKGSWNGVPDSCLFYIQPDLRAPLLRITIQTSGHHRCARNSAEVTGRFVILTEADVRRRGEHVSRLDEFKVTRAAFDSFCTVTQIEGANMATPISRVVQAAAAPVQLEGRVRRRRATASDNVVTQEFASNTRTESTEADRRRDAERVAQIYTELPTNALGVSEAPTIEELRASPALCAAFGVPYEGQPVEKGSPLAHESEAPKQIVRKVRGRLLNFD